MGKLRVIKVGPMTTIQDKGRFGHRQFGIPQSGVMDLESMKKVNYLVGNMEENPVVEFALSGIKLEALENTTLGIIGAMLRLEERMIDNASVQLIEGDVVEIFAPKKMYAYLGICGKMKAKLDFDSYSTYSTAGFGGIDGRTLKAGDILETEGNISFDQQTILIDERDDEVTTVRIEKGPEWNLLQELPDGKIFSVDSASNRIGIRLIGSTLKCDGSEIVSSAVIPGIIQLPANGQPIILMNDCQTTGGYPRIGKVIDEDMGKLAQLKHGSTLTLKLTAD